MPGNKTSFKTGQSGNPKGRPPKSRALTDILTKYGSKKVAGIDRKPVEAKSALAEMIWTAAISGQVHFRSENRECSFKYGPRPIDRDIELDWGQWWPLAVWLYHQIDGDLSISFQEKLGGEEGEGEGGTPTGGDQAPVLYIPDNGRDSPQAQTPVQEDPDEIKTEGDASSSEREPDTAPILEETEGAQSPLAVEDEARAPGGEHSGDADARVDPSAGWPAGNLFSDLR